MKDPEHEICWHQQVIEVEINTPFSDCNNYIHLQEHKIPVGCGLKIIGYSQLLENVMNSRNLSVFGNHRYRRSLVKFCLFVSYLVVIAHTSERIGILNTLNWENYFYLSILGPLIKSLLNTYEIEKIAWVYHLILEYTINLVCWPCVQIIENLGKLGNKKLFLNSQFFSLVIIKTNTQPNKQ